MNHALPIHPHVGNASPTPGSLWPTPSANASREAGFMPRSIPAYVLQPTIIRPRRPAHSMHPGMSPSLRGGRRPTKQSMGSHWCLLRRCACSGRPGLLRDARNDGVFMCHCEEGADRRGNPELATGVCFAAAPLAASGLLRCTRNDVEFSRHCEEGEDRRGNPDSATGLYHAAVPVAGAHGLLPATATASASTPTTSPTRPRKSAATRK